MRLSRTMLNFSAAFFLWIAVFACTHSRLTESEPTTTVVATSPETTVEPVPNAVDTPCKKDEWCYDREAQTAVEKLGSVLVASNPRDAAAWCRHYDKATPEQRKAFYALLLKALSYYESSWDPSVEYKENFKDVQGRDVVSRGLLQISIESGNAYGCGFRTEKEIHGVQANLDCGIRILSRWIKGDGVIQGGSSGEWKGASRYWSPFRKPEYIKGMRTRLQELSYCQ